MKKSARYRVSEKLVSPGLPGLQVATRLVTQLMPRISVFAYVCVRVCCVSGRGYIYLVYIRILLYSIASF